MTPRGSAPLIVWSHHPDVLQRTCSGTWGALPASQALTWNIFRTLELMPPAFWLRRLNATLDLAPPAPAPVTARVRLWSELPPPPNGNGTPKTKVEADVLIETEHAVWALLVCHTGDVVLPASAAQADVVAPLAHAASWHAGVRDCYVGLIVPESGEAPLARALVRRYRASPRAVQLRVARGHNPANVAGVGLTTWARLIRIVRDAATADTIDHAERLMAGRAAAWYDRLSP